MTTINREQHTIVGWEYWTEVRYEPLDEAATSREG